MSPQLHVCSMVWMLPHTYTPAHSCIATQTQSETLPFNLFSKVRLQIQQLFFSFGERQLNFGCNLILLSGSSQCEINVVMVKDIV